MKAFIQFFLILLLASCSVTHRQETVIGRLNPKEQVHKVDASCGECNFGLPGKDCTLAIRFDGKAYFVEGAHIDSFGNAHDSIGFCNSIRKAEVQGTLHDNRYIISYFRLLDPAKKEK